MYVWKPSELLSHRYVTYLRKYWIEIGKTQLYLPSVTVTKVWKLAYS